MAATWDVGGQPEEAVDDAVGGHEDAVQVGVFGDPLEFGDAADIGGIWTDHVDRLPQTVQHKYLESGLHVSNTKASLLPPLFVKTFSLRSTAIQTWGLDLHSGQFSSFCRPFSRSN